MTFGINLWDKNSSGIRITFCHPVLNYSAFNINNFLTPFEISHLFNVHAVPKHNDNYVIKKITMRLTLVA